MISKRRLFTKQALFFLVIALCPITLVAQMEVASISAMPKFFDPETGGSVSIIVNASPAMDGLYVHVLTYKQKELVRAELKLTEETPGTYSTNWDGKTDNGSIAQPGLYVLRVFDSVGSKYLSSEPGYITVGQPVPM